jgi:hypothetical protein
MKSRNNISKMVISLLIMTLCLSTVLGTAAAAEMPDLSRTGKISVTMKSTKTGEVVPGGELSLYKVADVRVDNGFKFVYTDDFASAGTAITEDTKLDGELAKTYAGIAKDKTPLKIVTVGSGGVAEFTELEPGLYLIVQKTAADGYSVIDPFLVTIPLKNADGSYVYDVDATPKAGTVDEPDKPDKPSEPHLPQTGQLWWPVPVLAFLGLILIIVGLALKRRSSQK